jgi:3-oxoacyl-[acyl-carrier-protein] synthase-3
MGRGIAVGVDAQRAVGVAEMTAGSELPLRILGTGVYRPREVIDSVAFDRRWQREPGWTERHCGVARRHRAAPDETSSWMGARAAEAALAAAGVDGTGLDAVVSACSVMEQAIPCLGVQIQQRLGLGASGIPAFDVNATCLGFMAALDLVASALATGRYRRVLIVSSEVASAGLDDNDPNTAPLFGDGAAAVVLDRAPDAASALLACQLATYGDGHELCQLRAGGTRLRVGDDPVAHAVGARFTMDGRGLYRLTRSHLPPFVERLLAAAGRGLDGIDCIVPHQASGQGLDHMVAALGMAPERVVRILPEVGNQIAASLPSALHQAIVDGRLRRGQHCLLLGTGAGLSLGGAVLRY